MSCSACIENPKKFLATSTHHLILQKNLPTVYDDEFLGKTFVPRAQRKEDQVRLVAPTQMALCLRPCLLRLLRRELLRAFATLDDSTPQRRISELRVWSYEPFIVFASSSSGYTSGQNLEVLYILNNTNNQNILRNYALHIEKLKQ